MLISKLIVNIGTLIGIMIAPVQSINPVILPPLTIGNGIIQDDKESSYNREISPIPEELATTTTIGIATTTKNCSCVTWIRQHTKFTFPRVEVASQIEALNFEPKIGSVALFIPSTLYSSAGHAALVEWVASSTFGVVEYNYKHCQVTHRTIKRDDIFLKGFFDNKHD